MKPKKNPKQALSQAQEARIAKLCGGYQQPRSGAGPFKKNDVLAKEYGELWECKRTDFLGSISIKKADLDDVESHALMDGQMPILTFELAGRDYVILTLEDYFERDYKRRDLRPDRTGIQRDRISDESSIPTSSRMGGAGEVHGEWSGGEQPILRPVSGQRSSNASQGNLPWNRGTTGYTLSGEVRMSRVRPRDTGALWGMGRGIRARKTQTPTTNKED